MKAQKIMTFGILALVLLSLSVVSATITLGEISQLGRTSGSFNVVIDSSENETIDLVVVDLITKNAKSINFSVDDLLFPMTIMDNESKTVVVSYRVDSGFDFGFNEELSTLLKVTGSVSGVANKTVFFDVNEDFCEEGCDNVGELKIKDLEYDLVEGEGDADDDYFYPLDDIEIIFEVDNDGDWDIENIEITMCLYDVDTDDVNDCVFDEDDFDLSEDDFDLDKGDDIEVVATLEIDPDELTAGNSDYKIFVSATGKIDDSDASDAIDGSVTSASEVEEFEILTDSDYVVVDDFELSSDIVSCGSTIQISAKVWNVGKDDLDDDEVFVKVFSKALDIEEEFEFDRGIDSMDFEEITFTFDVPQDLIEKKTYYVEFSAFDDEDMGNNDYFENEDEDEAKYDFFFAVQDCGGADVINDVNKPVVGAELISEDVVVGSEVLVKTTVTNPADTRDNFVVYVNGYESWAELVSVQPSVLDLGAGETGEVMIKFKPTTSGVHVFNVRISSPNSNIVQDVSLNVEESPSIFSFGDFGEGNVMYWIAAVLIVLIILLFLLIIILMIRRR
jgi:hypothetical protein